MSNIQQSILNKNRKDKFLLILNLPDPLKKINIFSQTERDSSKVNLDSLQYSIYGTVVPNTIVAPVSLPFGGQSLNVTTGKRDNYSEVTVNFTVDNTFSNWWVLWKWLNFINDASMSKLDSGDLIKFPKDSNDKVVYNSTMNLQPYQTNITIFGLDEYNVKKIQWTYTKAFITNLNGINYNYRDSGEIESAFTFTFTQLVTELL